MDERTKKDAEIHRLIDAMDRGEPDALDKLVSAIYPDLKRLAHFQLAGERPGHSLNTTEIVHEAFLRISTTERSWNSRQHYLRAAAIVMRHLLVDHARKKGAAKRGSGTQLVPLSEELFEAPEDDYLAVLELDAAMKVIGKIDPRMEKIIEYRCFAGLPAQEIADALNISLRTVEREWSRARGYIALAMEENSI